MAPFDAAAAGLRLRPRPKYLSLTLTAVQRAVAYRGTTLLSLASQLVWAGVLYSLWQFAFATRSTIEGFDWGEMRTYVLVSYAVNSLLSFHALARMMTVIRTGEVATELTRPVDYLKTQLALALGAALVEAALSGTIVLLVGRLFLNVEAPRSSLAALFFPVSVGLGYLIRFLIGYLVALLCFWTMNWVGLNWAQAAVINLLSGALIPLDFFPDGLRAMALATPFPAIVYTPIAIYLGKLQGIALAQALAVQALWAIALWALARLLWRPAARALEIQGG